MNDVMPESAEGLGDLKKIDSWDLNPERKTWDSSLEEGSRFLFSPKRDQLVVYEMCRAFVEEIVSLFPHVEKP